MLPELWRITSFRLTVLYGAFFALAVIGLLALIYEETARYQNQQVDQILRSESTLFTTASPEKLRGDIAYEIARDARHINFFGLFAPDRTLITGNLPHVPQELPLDGKPRELTQQAIADLFPNALQVRALGMTLSNGDVLIVARDVALLERVRQALFRGCLALGAVILALGILGGVFYSLPAVRHIRQIDAAARRIAAGDYAQRLPLGGRNRELDMLANIINTMLDETERLMGEVKSASDNIAHDLRTPLTRLRASIYRTQQSIESVSPLYPALDHALAQTDLLLARFRAISRISEIESKRRRAGFSHADLAAVLKQIRDLYEPLALQGRVRLVLDAPDDCVIACDPELLFEAIGNLVDNALKFTPEGGVVVIGLQRMHAGPEITVSDSGPGIPEDQRMLVMRRFYRAPAAHVVAGSGLGLSLVEAIAKLHDFSLVIDEAQGSGTRVSLRCWPCSVSESHHPPL